MKGLLVAILVAVIVGLGTHAAAVFFYPNLAMSRAMDALAGEAQGNAFVHAPRVTPQARRVVRPAPDIAYSACVFDLWRGPVEINVRPSEQLWSLSLYGADSDVFATFNDASHPNGVRVAIMRMGAAPPAGFDVALESPSRRGVALVRRLAPDAASFAAADAARQGDSCGLAASRGGV